MNVSAVRGFAVAQVELPKNRTSTMKITAVWIRPYTIA